jgi:beta-galactosidase
LSLAAAASGRRATITTIADAAPPAHVLAATPSGMAAILLLASLLASRATAASFTVAQDAFMYDSGDGRGALPHSVRSGSLHYHRAHPSTWADRIARLRALGLNTVQTYVPWNFHSQARGVYDVTSPSRDIVAFIKEVQAAGMLLLLRAGPYICGEHDFGGLPSYLLATPGISSAADLRTNNTAYVAAVTEWWSKLLPLVAPYTVANGGPIAMVQIENECATSLVHPRAPDGGAFTSPPPPPPLDGSYGNTGGAPADYAYMVALRALALQLLPAGTQLYTTDGNDAGYLSHGALPGLVFATGDGSGPPFAADGFNPPGWRAHTNSELYPGWLTHWGEAIANISAMSTVGDLSGILSVNASFNLCTFNAHHAAPALPPQLRPLTTPIPSNPTARSTTL